MDIGEMDTLIKNVDARTLRIEQILPTLATRGDLAAAIAPLATKEELAAAVAPLATRAELREEGERTRRRFDIVAEGLHQSIALIAEGYTTLDNKIGAVRTELNADVNALHRRVTRLEAKE